MIHKQIKIEMSVTIDFTINNNNNANDVPILTAITKCYS